MGRPAFRLIAGVFSIAIFAFHASADTTTVQTVLRSALATACDEDLPSLTRMAKNIADGTAALHHAPVRRGADIVGWGRSFMIERLGIIEVTRLAPGGTLANIQINLQVSDGSRIVPIYALLAGNDCEIVEARRLYYRPSGPVDRLELLDRTFTPTSAPTPLNPPLPTPEAIGDNNAAAVRVAVIDSGVNYRLPAVAKVLARDAGKQPLGYDFWDLDRFPFDSDTRGSPFYPQRSGTAVAAALIAEAPGALIIPYRFPFPDVGRMVDLLADANQSGARIALLSFAGRGRGDWRPFSGIASRYPDMLIVISAGPGGRNLDREPLFPASLKLTNALVVTAVNSSNEVLAGANWGTDTVDIAARADAISVFGFDGSVRPASGVGLAAARVAALAAGLLEIHPDWNAERLRRELIGRATHPADVTPRSRYGIIDLPPAPVSTADPS